MITLYASRDMSTGQLTGTPHNLVDVIDCTVTEERNGMFALTMRYPIGADYSFLLVPDAIIVATPRPDADPEPFRIYEIEQIIEGVVTVRANHIVYDLDGTGVQKSVVDGYKFAFLISRLNSWIGTAGPSGIVGFEVVNDGITDDETLFSFAEAFGTYWQIIGAAAEQFNAELKYVWDAVNSKCLVYFCAARGQVRNTVIKYGVNLVAMNRKLYVGALYSGVRAYWTSGGAIAAQCTYEYPTGYTGRKRTLWLDCTDMFQTIPSDADLRNAEKEYVDTHDFNPLSDLSVEFVPMENTTEYTPPPVVSALTDTTPYSLRASGGSLSLGLRNRETDSLIGGTVAWNQLVPNANATFTSGNTDTRALNFYFRQNVSPYTSLYNKSNVQIGILSSIVSASFDGYIQMVHAGAVRNMYYVPRATISVQNGHKYLFSLNITGTDVSTVGGVTAKDIQIYDLTAMFGSAIADYVYTLESGTAGAGIAWLKSYGFFSEDYYPYHAATLESVKTSAHVMRDADNNIIGNYALDPIDLRGILKKDASNNLYYDGDTYAADGTVTRKYAIRAYQSGDATDGSTMITDGTNTVYKLTTPTTESASQYINPQIVDASGTEQYVDAGTRDFEMPVGHSTEYTFVPDDNRLYLCDTATVDASLIGVSATAKCVRVVYNVLTDMYDTVTVGTVQQDIVDTILKLGE